MTSNSPNKIFTDAADCSVKRVETDRKRKATDEAKESRRRSKYNNSVQPTRSPEEVNDDIPSEDIEQLRKN